MSVCLDLCALSALGTGSPSHGGEDLFSWLHFFPPSSPQTVLLKSVGLRLFLLCLLNRNHAPGFLCGGTL